VGEAELRSELAVHNWSLEGGWFDMAVDQVVFDEASQHFDKND
jgi:hypothetical protein